MSTAAQHTPLPWRVGAPPEKVCAEGFTSNGSAKTILSVNDAKWMGEGEQWANASLIVRAVNSHQSLVDALKWMVEQDETNRGDEPLAEHGGRTWNEINAYWIDGLNKANDALAAAESRP